MQGKWLMKEIACWLKAVEEYRILIGAETFPFNSFKNTTTSNCKELIKVCIYP